MNRNYYNIETVEELLNKSKQLQNKIRQELSLQAVTSSADEEFNIKQFPPIWDNSLLGPYVRSVVANHIQETTSPSKKMSKRTNVPIKADGSQANTNKIKPKLMNAIQVKDALLDFHRRSSSVGTQVIEKSTKLTPKQRGRVSPRPTISHRSNLKENALKVSKINLKSNKLAASSSCRLPLQRFSESTNKIIDFSTEHPDLELDMTSEQMTLFPRRFRRSTVCLDQNEESVNVVEAVVKAPQPPPSLVKRDTWNSILMLNQAKNNSAYKIVRLKETNLHSAPRPEMKEPEESFNIISSIPSKCLFTLQKQSDLLAKQKKFRSQHFPVLCIRPQFQVQKVASISIRAESENILKAAVGNNPPKNVKYFEYKHGDEGAVKNEEKPFELKNIPGGVAEDKMLLKEEPYPIKNNKFFKALEFNDLPEYSATNSTSSSFNHQSSSSISSISSNSLLKDLNPSTAFKGVHNSLPSSSGKTVISPSCRRETHVQTENEHKETVSTNTSPVLYRARTQEESELTSSENIKDTLNKSANLRKTQNSVEDDIIERIFERIRNDLPGALEVYKKHNINTNIDINTILPISSFDEKHTEVQKKHSSPKSSSNDELTDKLLPNEVERQLRNFQAKIEKEAYHSKSIQTMPNDGCNDTRSMPEARKEFILPQKAYIVENMDRIKSSAFYNSKSDGRRTMEERKEYPTDEEIKRAVKIFIGSLSLDRCLDEKKIIINDINKNRRSSTFTNSELLNRGNINKYTSSDSPKISSDRNTINHNQLERNFKKMRNSVRWCDISGSSSSIVLSSSDLESESDITNGMQTLHTNDINSLSDGEIKSVGEI